MAKNDITAYDVGGLSCVPTYPRFSWQVAAGTPPTIETGEPIKLSGAAAPTVIAFVDADHTIETDQLCVGIGALDSTEVSGTAGYVSVYVPVPQVIWQAKALTSTLANTRALIDAMVGDNYVVDLTSDLFTIDTAAGNNAANLFVVVGGDPITSTIYFMIRVSGCIIGRAAIT